MKKCFDNSDLRKILKINHTQITLCENMNIITERWNQFIKNK
jgi:hypothetical protein